MILLCILILQVLPFTGAALLFAGSCAFEDSSCGYESDETFLPWTLNEAGHYISVDTSSQGERAVLLSPELQTEEWSCIRLIYQIATSLESLSDPTRLNLYVRQEGESFDCLLWSAKEPSDSWLIASLDLTNRTKKYKIVLEGILGQDKFASIAIFEIKITPGYCIDCDFEENHLCGFRNHWNPNVNWFVGGGNIRNSQSILPRDHTLNSEFGHYMYVDSVYVKHFQEVAQLISPRTSIPMSGCLSFYYQLKQESGIVFTLYIRDTSGFYEEIWKTDGTVNEEWSLAEADFDSPYPVEVIFEVAFNSPKGGYVALDDLSFSPVYCSNQTGLSFNPAEASCNFEEDLCNFYQDRKDGPGWSRVKVKPNVYRTGDHTTGFETLPAYPGECTFEKGECAFTQERRNRSSWHRRRGQTPTSYTGPKGDHTTGVGYYMYIEASNMMYGQKARLTSRSLRGISGKQCLTFFYNMFGAGTGILNVYMKKEGDSEETLLWRRRGEQSITWLRGLIEYGCDTYHQIVFEAIRGVSIRSDIAIDDIVFQAGPCIEMEDMILHSSGYSEDLNEIEY
ncbi:MAM domain-containing protein 2 isoform X3 [Alligator sinensis]|uniref:MAM domain-containing protein 2 isoform X3 n=1 Tax=Alligator sinensis TaxID=38654 RepID=A0A3Q0GKG6_ALLSI|nr:MAM domain-containing protein 2 isoform X3 [Alligator sinensis]